MAAASNKARTSQLRSSSHAFCNAFLANKPPGDMLDTFFTRSPKITEHGPAWAASRLPFLGKTFTGRRSTQDYSGNSKGSTCDDYFELLASKLSFHPNEKTFPPESEHVVDAEAGGSGVVSVMGHAKFASVATGKSWEEDFIYRLSGFDEEGKIGHWEIWADPLSAWDAIGG
ncbi:MAG: hypothetical protein M1830_007625 [Pleopsidium flavum]|nr:MAG: hypothetical protein M1830_007625 [Pleopsidium flavum]